MHQCPCCFSPLLKHIRAGEIYFFCNECWQEIPDFKAQHNCETLPMTTVNHRILEKRDRPGQTGSLGRI